MKKQIFLLMAGSAMVVASCNQPTSDVSEGQVDSMVNARVEEIRAEMMAQNDSLINVMAQQRADSIIAAMTGKKVVTTTRHTSSGGTTTTTTTTTKPDTKDETIGRGKPKIGDKTNEDEIGRGKPKIGDKTNEDEIGRGKPKIGNK